MTIFFRLISIVVTMVVFLGLGNAQTASVTWNLTAPDSIHVSSLTGNISAPDQLLTNLFVPPTGGYTTNTAQRTSPKSGGVDGTWPADAAEVSTRYMEFSVSPTSGNNFLINSISFYLWANSGSSMRATVYYSKDPTFSTKTQIGSTWSLSSIAPTSPNITATPNVTVISGETLYLRVYPWYTTATTTKYLVTKSVIISGSTSTGSASIVPSVSSLSSFSQVLGTPSVTKSYTVSATGLTESVVVTPPADFEVSNDGGSNWYTNSSPLSLTQTGGSLDGQPVTILARLNGGSIGSYSGNITHATFGATTQNVSVSGTTIASEPTVQSSLSFGTVTNNSIIADYSGGNGTNRIVVVRSGSAVSWSPTDAAAVTGVNSDFSNASDQGNGNKVVYDGAGTSVTVTGLAGSTTYYFAVYEYNTGSGNTQNYLNISPGTGNQTTLAGPTITLSTSSLSFGNILVDSTSTIQTFDLSGSLLTPSSGNITVTAPSNYEVSTSSGSGYSSSIQAAYTSGTLSSTVIYVRFKPTAIQTYTGNISNSGGGAATQNVAVSGAGVSTMEANVLQAEDGILHSAYILNQYAGYSGIGYVDIANKTGAGLEFTFRRATAASDTVTMYYALGGSSRAYTVSLNGTSVGSLTFTSTGNWSTWSTVSMMIPLQSGVNRLIFTATTNLSDNANLDKMRISGPTATQVYKLTLTASGSGTVSALPSSSDSMYDGGSSVTLTATPTGGNEFYHWTGTDKSTANPFIITMNKHKNEAAVITPAGGFGAFQYEPTSKGFSSVASLGYSNGTTGGSGPDSQVAYVTNFTEFKNLMLLRDDVGRVLNFPPLTVYVIGTITGSDMVDVEDAYDISIIGVGVDATLSGFGLKIVRSRNIIVRNIRVQNSSIDGIEVQGDDTEGTGDHVWIDHCTVTNCYDGAIDVTHTASYVTLSWNRIYNHDKSCLMGHSDSQTSDVAMKVTYHHNYFDSTGQRHPRVRYGKAHVYNNYYRKNGLYGISSNDGAEVLVEGSYFQNVPLPMDTSRDGSIPGNVVERENIFVSCGANQTRGSVFEPSTYYSYSLDSAADIPAMLSSYTGSGKYDFSAGAPTTGYYSITSSAVNGAISKSPNQTTYASGTSVQLTATPNTGYHFVEWTGAVSGSTNPVSVTMDGNKSVSAIFAIDTYTITASAGTGGTISPSGPVVVDYNADQKFTITPSPGYYLNELLVDALHVDSTESYTFHTVTANHTISASFATNPPGTFTLTTHATNGSVLKAPEQTFYDSGSTVQLTALPNDHYHFVGWSDSLAGTNNPATLVMNNNKIVTATFAIDQYTLTINAVHGSVTQNPPTGPYNYGTNVILSAIPDDGYEFAGWSDSLTGSKNPDTLAMNSNKVITANFNALVIAMGSYRSHQSGNWNDVTTWEWYNGSAWISPAPSTPTSGDDAIAIRNTHIVVANASIAVDQVSVNTGGTLNVAAGQTVTIDDGADSLDMIVSGTLNQFGTVAATGRLDFENGGLYIYSIPGGGSTMPLATWRTGSTCRIDSTTGSTPTNLNLQSLSNLVWNGTNSGANGGPNFADGAVINGDITLLSSKSFQWRLTNLVTGQTKNIYIRGNLYVNGSTAVLTSTGSGADTAAKAIINIDGDVNVLAGQWSLNNSGSAYAEWKVKGNINITGGTLQSGASGWGGRRTLTFNGGTTQTFNLSGTGTIGTAATTFKVSNNSIVEMGFPFTIMANGRLHLESGKFITSSTNMLAIPATGAVVGGNDTSYVDGPLTNTVASTSATTKVFPIGKGAAYRPVTLTVNQDAITATPYTAEVFNEAPAARTLPLALKSVSSARYYHVTKGSGANLSPTLGATIQLNYGADDSVASAVNLRVAKDDGVGNWLNLGGSGTAEMTGSITSNAFYSFSDFALAVADTGIAANLPTVLTSSVSRISTTFATTGGNITNDGGGAVIARGVCWNTTGSPTIADDTTLNGTGAGAFSTLLTGLTPGITYHLRAYGTNSAGTGYGDEISFSTLTAIVPPTVTTTTISSIQVTTAVGGGSVMDWGGDSVTVRGVCWNTTGTPTITAAHSSDGSGLGSFSSGLSNLIGGTLYHVRAYATNSSGTGYGNEVTFTTQTAAPDTTVIVAKDGSGDYTTVQAAFRAVPLNYTGTWTIFVKKGVYYEKDTLAAGKVNVVLIGEDRDSTIITYDDYGDRYGTGVPGTSGSFTIAIDASDFVAKNITFRNTYSPQPGVSGTQAVALRTQGDRHEYINCKILGYQDTYYAWGGSGTGRMYHRNCYIEGTVDFIFGRNIVVFDSCTIHEIRNAATLTAAATDPGSKYGLTFRNCTIITDSLGYDGVPITSMYLGRPWQSSPRTVLLNSYEPASLNAGGWLSWNVVPALYAESNCYGPGSSTSGRVAWSSQLPLATAADYSLSNIFARNSASSSLILYDWMPANAMSDPPLLIRITSSAGANGSIAPSGMVNVAYNSSPTYAITPIPGYHVSDVLVDGVSVGATESYTFSNIAANHTISATFEMSTYTLAVNATDGTVSKVPDQLTYIYGDTVQVTALPNSGYHFVNWTGSITGTVNPITVTMDSNKTITANFARTAFTLNVTVDGNGSVTKNPDQPTYDKDSVVYLTAVPENGYRFTSWSGDATGSTNPIPVTMDGNKNITATFSQDSAYQVMYRSFMQESLAVSVDNKGKWGKYVSPTKPDKVTFNAWVTPIYRGSVKLSFSMEATGVILKGTDTLTTFTKMKTVAVTIVDTSAAEGSSLQIIGTGLKGKAIAIKYDWSVVVSAKAVHYKGLATYTENQPRLPMPNRVNALHNTFFGTGYGSTGMMVGEIRTDSVKNYGWFQTVKYGDVLKTLYIPKTSTFQTGTPQGFDQYLSGKPVLKQNKTLVPTKYNNKLLADMIALKFNITASAMKYTPIGFGELIYDDGTENPLNGMMVKEIAAFGDSLMMGWLVDSTYGTKQLKAHHFAGAAEFAALDEVVAMINSSFEGTLDTTSFGDSLRFTGVKELIDVSYLKPNEDVIPAEIVPLAGDYMNQDPVSYTLHQNYPNPFNPMTNIQFDLADDAFVTLKVYNVLGQEVATLFDREEMNSGVQEVQFNANGLASGVYFYRIVAEQLSEDGNTSMMFQTVKKMLLVK